MKLPHGNPFNFQQSYVSPCPHFSLPHHLSLFLCPHIFLPLAVVCVTSADSAGFLELITAADSCINYSWPCSARTSNTAINHTQTNSHIGVFWVFRTLSQTLNTSGQLSWVRRRVSFLFIFLRLIAQKDNLSPFRSVIFCCLNSVGP